MEPKVRRFWQFHLSTAIVAMFTVGAFVGLNVTRHVIDVPHELIGRMREVNEPHWACGWPLNYIKVSLVSYKTAESFVALQSFPFHRDYWKWPGFVDYRALIIDLLLMVLTTIG